MDMHFDGVIFHTHAAELERRTKHPFPPFAVLDVRPPAEYGKSRIPGSIHVDPERMESLPAGTTEATEMFVVGNSHVDSAVRKTALALKRLGVRRVVEVTGGYREWRRRGLPEEGAEEGKKTAA